MKFWDIDTNEKVYINSYCDGKILLVKYKDKNGNKRIFKIINPMISFNDNSLLIKGIMKKNHLTSGEVTLRLFRFNPCLLKKEKENEN